MTGNALITDIAKQDSYQIRFDLEDFENDMRYAVFDDFSLDGNDEYRIHIGAYSGNAGWITDYFYSCVWFLSNDLRWHIIAPYQQFGEIIPTEWKLVSPHIFPVPYTVLKEC